MRFDLATINWQALAAIATFLAVAFALYQHRSHLKRERSEELREIAEEIVHPLRRGLRTLLSNFDEGVFRTTQSWNLHSIKEQDQYLFSRLPEDLKKDMKRLDGKLEFFKNLSTQTLSAVRELIGHAVKASLENSEHKDAFGSKPPPKETAYSYYKSEVGGKHFNAHVATFIRENITFDESIERFSEKNQLPNKKITSEEFIVQGINIRIPGREYFVKTISKTKDMIKDNEGVSAYFEKMREVHQEGEELEEKLNQFLENQK